MAFDPRKLGVVDMSDPSFVYGRSATANAAPFSGLIVHHTADKPIENLVRYGQRVDEARGGAFGYHFYIGKDGRIIQGAPLDKRTNHIKPPSHRMRKGGGNLSNANAIGISLVGAEHGATPEQKAAAERLGRALMTEYGISPEFVFGHGEIQGDRQHTEGADLVGILRGGASPDGDPNVVRVADARGILERYEASKTDASPTVTRPAAEPRAKATGTAQDILKRYEASKEPSVTTAAPKAPEGLDAEAPPNWWERRIADADKAIFGDAEFPVRELVDATQLQSPFRVPELKGQIIDLLKMKGLDGKSAELAYSDFMLGLRMADNEKAMGEMVRTQLGVDPIADINGNLYVDIGGNRYALDKSGLSPRDIGEAGKMAAAGAGVVFPAVRAAEGVVGAVFGRGAGRTLGRAIGGGLGGGLEQAGEQFISEYYGGNQGFKTERVVAGAAFGMGGEALGRVAEVLGPRVARLFSQGRENARSMEEFQQNLRTLGLSPEEIQRAIGIATERPTPAQFGPEAAARIADARMLPESVELTAGQATRDLARWADEDMARNTRLGEEAAGEALELSREQQHRLGANAGHLFGVWSDRGGRDARGGLVQGVLVERRARDWAEVNAAYTAAREAGDVTLHPRVILDMADNLRDEVREMATPSMMPVTREMLDELDDIVSAAVNTRGRTVTPVSLQRLEQWRSKVTGLIPQVKDNGDTVGLRRLIRAYDDAATRSFGQSALNGDPRTIGLWRAAVASRRDFGRQWESDDILATLTERTGRGEGQGRLKVAPDNVMQALMGASKFGVKSSDEGVREAVLNVRNILGENSDAWHQIKGQGLVQLLGYDPAVRLSAEGMLTSIESVPVSLVKNLSDAKSNYRELYNTLYTAEERAMIDRLARTVDLINNKPAVAGQMNRSGTGYAVVEATRKQTERALRFMNFVATRGGPFGAIMAGFFRDKIKDAADLARAESARRSIGGLPEPAAPASAVTRGVGAMIGATGAESVNERR